MSLARGCEGWLGLIRLTEPLRLFTRSSSPSREVSAGREIEGPMMEPSCEFLNWATMVAAGAERSIVLAEGAVRCRFGGGGICVDIGAGRGEGRGEVKRDKELYYN